MNVEVWRPVVGYEGSYEVSDHGRVRSIDRLIWHTGGRAPRWIKLKGRPRKLWAGGYYPIVRIGSHNNKRTFLVHALVATAFLGPRPSSRHQVCHKQGIKAGNHVDNLYWGTTWDNATDAIRMGEKASGERHFWSKLTEKDVIEIRKQKGQQSLRDLARQYGVSVNAIHSVLRDLTWVAVGG